MNRVILSGRLVADPEVRVTGEKNVTVARYRLAVDRKHKQNGEQAADFINCVAFGRNGKFAQDYLRKGVKIMVEGHIQTGSYKNKDGDTIYTTDVIVESHEFCESKRTSGNDVPANADSYSGGYNVPPSFDNSSPEFSEMPEDDGDLPF